MANKNSGKYSERRWAVPSKRAKGYADDLREKVHTYGKKEGKELTNKEFALRMGYLQAQNDNAGIYKYKKALAEGKSQEEAIRISKQRGKGKTA